MPRTYTTKHTVYKFDELSDEAKENAVNELWDINVDHQWYESTYEDAEENALFKISEFDLDRASYVKGDFLENASDTAEKIKENHGDVCQTHIEAVEFLEEREKIIENAPKDENGDFENEYELDSKLDELEEKYKHDLQECYRIMLSKDYEYLTSKESVIETIEANEYEFTKEGQLK